VLLVFVASGGASLASEPLKNATVSWLGNSFPGADKWVQQDIHGMAVTPDGTVYTNVEWDEAGRNVGVYKDGDEHRLFVSDQATAAIKVFDAETMTALKQWPLERTGPLAFDRNGALWVLQEAGAGKPARVVRFSPQSKSLPQTIELPPEVVPTTLGVDAAGTRLFVADDGPGQQIRIYSQLDTTPSLVQLFGAHGGIL